MHTQTTLLKTALAHLCDSDVLIGLSVSLIVLTSAMAMRYPWYSHGAFVSLNTSSVSVSNALAETKTNKCQTNRKCYLVVRSAQKELANGCQLNLFTQKVNN